MKFIITITAPTLPTLNEVQVDTRYAEHKFVSHKSRWTGPCPVTGAHCGDVLGRHHSFIDEGELYSEMYEKWSKVYWVTRIEKVTE